KVPGAAVKCEHYFQGAVEKISEVGRYKRLHDDFQTVDGSFKLVIERRPEPHPQEDADAPLSISEKFEGAVETLIQDLEFLRDTAARTQFQAHQLSWIEYVVQVRDDLKGGLAKADAPYFFEPLGPLEQLQRLLGKEPPQINKEIVGRAADLSLDEVARGLEQVRDDLSPRHFSDHDRARLDKFSSGIAP